MKRFLCCLMMILGISAATAAAAEPGQILSFDSDGEQLILYAQGDGEIESVQCQTGSVLCEDVSYGWIEEEDIPVRTLILLDNSLSVRQDYRQKINEIMTNLAANRMAKELISIATFSDTLTYVLEDSSDYGAMKQAIDGIAYADQETYLTDVLYELLAGWNADQEDSGFRRIIVISDGVDNKAIGYTKDELYDMLEEHPYPIYTVGCRSQSGTNNAELTNMFALSRMTSAASWIIDDITDNMEVAREVAKTNRTWRVEAAPPSEVCDGSKKGVKLTIVSSGQTYESSVTMDMPFGKAETTEAEAPSKEETRAKERRTRAETEAEVTGPAEEETLWWMSINPILIIIAVIVILLLVILVAVILLLVRRRRERDKFETAPEGATHDAEPWYPGSGQKPIDTAMVKGGGNTAMIWGDQSVPHMLVLTDQDNPARVFEVPLSGPVIIGRSRTQGCQVVLDYESSVSHRHCQIRLDGTQLKVKDLGSTNGTVLNGKKIVGETNLYSGSILTLGNLKLKVELRR